MKAQTFQNLRTCTYYVQFSPQTNNQQKKTQKLKFSQENSKEKIDLLYTIEKNFRKNKSENYIKR